MKQALKYYVLVRISITLVAVALAVVWPAAAQLARHVKVAKVPADLLRAEGFDPAQSAGLFVGIRRFEDDKFLEVPYAVDDAVDLAYLFALELELIPPARVVLALAGEPQKPASRARLERLLELGTIREPAGLISILRLLDQQRKVSGPKGLFVATFATHGFSDQGSDFLVAANSLRSYIERTGVALNDAFDVVARAGAPRRLVLLDACRQRFTAGQRGAGSSAMTESFGDAIAGAEGQVVISGTTLGGYSYDDKERMNGVFTAALLDGLRGAAPADAHSFITVRTLADYVNERVLAWVRDNRPEDSEQSRGISRRLEGAVAEMPLAVDAGGLRAAGDYRQRRDAALARLAQNLDTPLTGAIYDQMKAFLAPASPGAERLALLAEIEALDGSARMRRALESYWRTDGAASPLAVDPPPAGSDRRTVASPPATAGAKPGPYKDPVLGIDFVVIEPGSFQMGSPTSEQDRSTDETLHKVTLTRGFWMGATEVTQGQWQKLMGGNPSKYQACGAGCPVEMVNWYEALAFANELSARSNLETCYQLSGKSGKKPGEGLVYRQVRFKDLGCRGYRLPTEAEWEYAARAGTNARYAGTDDEKAVCEYGNVSKDFGCDDGHFGPAPVASFHPNGFRLYDMTGNVWEWVWDWFGSYKADARDPMGPASGRSRVFRGGSFVVSPRVVRVAYRYFDESSYRSSGLGFRVARSLP